MLWPGLLRLVILATVLAAVAYGGYYVGYMDRVTEERRFPWIKGTWEIIHVNEHGEEQ